MIAINARIGQIVKASVLAGVLLGAAFASPAPAVASEGGELKHLDWSFKAPFGTFDRDALRRGYKVYKEVCAACHAMHYVSFRNLVDKGGPEFSEAQAKALAAEYKVQDGPDSAGDMFERDGRLSDRFPSPYPNDEAASSANGGAIPPDLSLMTKARPHGPDYVYSLLTGYTEPPAGFDAGELHYNTAFPGHLIAMPQPLNDGQVDFEDGTPNTVDQMSKDVVQFMHWAAEPKLEQRHRLGLQVMVFLIVLSGLLFLAMRKIWANQH